MNPPIEKTLKPETVNEVRLLNRIRELSLKLYEKGVNISAPSITDDVVELRSAQLPVRLELAASVEGKWQDDYRFAVMAQTMAPMSGDTDIRFGYYMDRLAMQHWTPELRAQELGHMHQKLIRKLAHTVE